jgi:sugar lactone lactonase YvrE
MMFDQRGQQRCFRWRRAVAAMAATAAAVGMGAGALVARANPGDPPGTIRTVAGTTRNYSQGGFSGDGGPATDAQLYNPRAVGIGRDGEVYVADALNHRIRRIDAKGVITTVAGNPQGTSGNGSPNGGFGGDGGPAVQAQLNQPHGVAVDSRGNVYIADSVNNRIRKIDAASGTINTIAGGDMKHGQPDGPAATAVLKFPKSLFMTPNDVLYICNTGGNEIIKTDVKATPLVFTRVAGNSQSKRYGGDGGFATDAQLNHPEGVWVTPNGTVFISDSENNLVRKVTPDGKISTIAGDVDAASRAAGSNQPVPGDSGGDGGPATAAHLNGPRGIAVDSAGDIFVAEERGARIRRIDPSGVITTIAGTGQTKPPGHDPRIAGDPGPAPALQAQFDTIHEINLDGNANLWIADSKNNRVRVISDPAHAPSGNPGSAPPNAEPSPTTTTAAPPTTTSTAPDTTTTTVPPTTTTTAAPTNSNSAPAGRGSKKSSTNTTSTTAAGGAAGHKAKGGHSAGK